MISIKTNQELAIMQKCGAITATVMEKVLKNTKPGVSKLELDKLATSEITRLGGKLSFTTVPGYNFATCITVNEEVVHGIPKNYVLKEFDLVSIDLGVRLQGLHTDMARTIFLGEPAKKIQNFISTGEKALKLAIKKAVIGNRIVNISETIQKIVEGANYSVVRALVGHGIGEKLHQPPEVPGFVTKDPGPVLCSGMTIAIEVIYAMGEPDVVIKEDGWTIATRDSKLAGLFEDTVAITKAGPLILTRQD